MEDLLIEKFKKIKKMGWIKSHRPNNVDGGAGNTLEDLLGIKENNCAQADFGEFEIKSQRKNTNSKISLFTKSPSAPEKANNILKEKFGEIRNNSSKKKLYASIFGNRETLVYEKYQMKLKVDKRCKKVFLQVNEARKKTYQVVYWTFEDLQKSAQKITHLVLFSYEQKIENSIRYLKFLNAFFFYHFSFEFFIEMLKKGDIQFDIRIGEYNSGANKGKAHDHGSGFRIDRTKIAKLYLHSIEVC